MAIGFVTLALTARAQDAEQREEKAMASEPLVVERGAHHKVWQTVSRRVTSFGREHFVTNSYTELRTGMHYLKEGQWEESRDTIEIFAEGAIARQGPSQVIWSPNLNRESAVDVLTEDGKRFRSHILGLAYTDAVSGKSVLIAEPKDCIGEVVGNQVFYRDAFAGPFRADVRYTYTASGITQDILIREVLPSPGDYDLDEDRVRIEVWTEFTDVPEPTKSFGVLKTEDDSLARQLMVDPDLTDVTLDFGAVRIGPGSAFPLESTPADSFEKESAPVAKSWIELGGRTFLIEKIDLRDIREQVNRLPKSAALNAAGKAQMQAATKAAAPRRQLLANMHSPARKEAKVTGEVMRTAAVIPPEKGFVLDYSMVSSATNFTFKGDTTYYVSGTVTLSGTTVLESAVIKYTNNAAKLKVLGPLDCRTDGHRPAIFTAMHDNTVGETIGGSSGNPTNGIYYGYYLEIIGNTNVIDLHDVRMRHGFYCINMDSGSRLLLRHSQFSSNNAAVVIQGGEVRMRNVLIHDSKYAFGTAGTNNWGEHVTFHRLTYLRSSSGSTHNTFLTNSLVLSVTNFAVYTGANVVSNLSDSGYFQTAGQGQRYLAASSTNRNAGTTNINPDLLADLKTRTTYPPTVLTAINQSTNLSAVVERDVSQPDLGYHYDVLDWLFGGVAMTNVTLTVTNGAAIGIDVTKTNYGIRLGSGASIISDGNPTNFNRFVRNSLVQEVAVGNAAIPTPLFADTVPRPANVTTIRARFTDFPSLPASYLFNQEYGLGTLTTLALRDSSVRGGNLVFYPNSSNIVVTFTNTLFDRVNLKIYDYTQSKITAYNNLFREGSNYLQSTTGSVWDWKNNLFDKTALFQYDFGTFTHNFNGYVTNFTRLTNNGANDRILTNSPAYEVGALGRYYLPTNSPLIDAGSTNASAVGLYSYTTATNQVKEGASTNDIGLHYIALNSSGQPVDSDGDGIADYIEDPNGNGLTDGSENSASNPVLTMVSTMNYIKGGPAKRFDTNAIAYDSDSVNFNGGQFKIRITTGAEANDKLGIRHEGTGATQLGATTNTISYGGTNIATYTGGTGTNALVIAFNTNAVNASVQALARNLTFQSLSNAPAISNRVVAFELTDGKGGTNAPTSVAINMVCPDAIDAFVVIDISQSLSTNDFQTAKQAASNFVTHLNFSTDRVGLISFAGDAYLNSPLTNNGAYVQSLILNLITNGGTRFHPPLDMVRSNMTSTASNVLPVLVLLSDGQSGSQGGLYTNLVLATNAALAVKDAGIRVITVAYGTNSGASGGTNLMKWFASSPNDAYYAPTIAEINTNFSSIADGICRGNTAPSAVIESPTNGAFFPGLSVKIVASASDADGSVTNLAVFHGTTNIGSGTGTNLTFTWTPPGGGNYSLYAKATDNAGGIGTSAAISFTVNGGPAVNAGADLQLMLIGTNSVFTNLTGTVTDADNLPTGRVLSIAWSSVSGPGPIFLAPAPADPTEPRKAKVTFTKPGIYTLRLTASDSLLSASDDIIITVNKTNVAPQVYAGTNQTITFPSPVYLPGAASDDGAPIGGALTVKWSGPAGVQFASDTVTNTFARFNAPGVYPLTLVASDGAVTNGGLSTTQSVTITVELPKEQTIYRNADFVSAGVGGMHGMFGLVANPKPGSGAISISGIVTNIKQAFLYWSGPVDSENKDINGTVLVNGRLVEGRNIGAGYSDDWHYYYEGGRHDFPHSYSYRADITDLVRFHGDGIYTLANFTKGREAEVNGASIIVVQEDPDSTNKHDLILWNGNDSNENFAYHPIINLYFPAYSIASSGSRVFLGGNFYSGTVPNRNHFAVLGSDGRLEPSFTPISGIASNDSTVRAVLPMTDGSVLVGGEFISVDGVTRKRITRFESNGILATNFNLDINGTVLCMARDQNGKILIGGAFTSIDGTSANKVARLLSTGQLDTNFSAAAIDYSVFAVASDRNTNVVIGGDFNSVGGTARSKLARLNGGGALQGASNPSIDNVVRAILPNESGKIFIGGDFSTVQGSNRFGIARLNEDLSIDVGFTNSVAGTVANTNYNAYLGVAAVHSIIQLDTNRIIIAGRFMKVDGIVRNRIAIINQTNGSLDTWQSSVTVDPWIPYFNGYYDATAVNSIALQADGKLLVAGNFSTINGGLPVNGAFRLLADGAFDPSFRVTDAGGLIAFRDVLHTTGDDVRIELHVSDGQSFLSPDQRADPALLLNGIVWMDNQSVSNCGVYNDKQIFAGDSVPSAYWPCLGLWDITNKIVPSALLATGSQTLLLTGNQYPSAQFGGSGGSDFVTLVAAMLRMPANTNATNQAYVEAAPVYLPPVAWSDDFVVSRSLGRRILNVLSNDICHQGGLLTISSVSSPSHGRTEILYENSAVLYSAEPGYSGTDVFTYSVVDDNGNSSSATVSVQVTGANDPVLIRMGERKAGSLDASDYPSPFRGGGQYAEFYRYDAVRGDTVDIVVSNVSFGTHAYVYDSRGVVIASGSFVEGGAFALMTSITDYTNAESGPHFIEVTSHNPGATGAYDLHLSSIQSQPLPRLEVNGTPLDDDLPYFLGVVEESKSLTNTFILRNIGRMQLDGVTVEITQTGSTATIAPATIASLPGGRGTPLVTTITAQTGAFGLTEKSIKILHTLLGGRSNRVQFYVNPAGAEATPVVITAPADGSVLRAPASVSVTAVPVEDGGGFTNVTKVEFYTDGPRSRLKIGEASAPPYTINWQQPEPGSYRIFATAYLDVLGGNPLMAVSPSIAIMIADQNYNSPPQVNADTLSVALNSKTNFLNVLANDSDTDGDALRIVSLAGTTQGTLAISSDGKGILYTPPADTFGEESFGYTVDDGRNGRSRSVATVRIVAATVAITYPTSATSLTVSNTVAVLVNATTSQGAILNVDLFTNGVKAGTVATNPYAINWKPLASGFYTLKAVANDTAGNRVESDSVTVGVGSPGASPPMAAFSNLREGDRLRDGIFNLLGTADSTNVSETVSYQLKLLKQTTNGVVEVADLTPLAVDGNGFHVGRVAAGGLLAALDFTGIRNGVYSLSLAVRSGGKESRTEVKFALESNAKLGQLTFSEEDLVVPLGGIPISVVRTYNSFKTDLGDFGTSWTYSINDVEVEIDEQRGFVEDEETPPKDFSMRLGGGRNITLTLPGGQRTTFMYSLNPGPNDGGVPCFCYEAKWEAAPGVYAQLAPLDNNRLQFIPWQKVIPPYWLGAADTPYDSYDFSGFVLTNSDGTEYTLKGDDLDDHALPPELSQLRSVHAYGTPKLRSIRTRSGDQIILNNYPLTGTNYLRVSQYNPLQSPSIKTNSILLIRNASGAIESAYGPESLNTDGTLKSGAIASVKYSYSSSYLVTVERLVKSSPLTYETNRYEYTNATHPHFITGIIDARGVRVATTGKDAQGRLTSLKGAGQTHGTRFIHDAANLRETAIDPLGYQTIHEFDRRGNVVRSIDALGQLTRRDYDDAGNQLSETDALGHTQRFGYDSLGNRTSSVDASGHTNFATFGSRRQLLTAVDALGRGVTNAYDSADNLLATTNALGHVTRQLYDSRGLLSASFDALNNLTTNRYDSTGRLTNTATLSAQSSILSSNAYAYDDRGNRTNETTWVTINGTLQTVTTSFEFDARNRLVRSLDALGYTNTTTYNALGKAESTTDKMGRETRHWFDARGNLIQTAYPSDANTPAVVTRTVFDELNRPIYAQGRAAAPDPADSDETTAIATHTIYNPLGRVERTESLTNVVIGWTEVDGAPATVLADAGGMFADTSTEFDEVGRVLSQTDAQGVTTFFEHDENGRRTATTVYDDDSRAMTTRSLYDAAGNVTVTLDALGRGTTNVFDALYRSVELQLADGTKRFTVYDELGRRVAEVDQAGVTNRFGFDGLGRLNASTNAWATANATWATYRFDELGRQTNQVDALGRATRFAFDKLGRRVGRWLPGGQSEGFAYNAAGNATWQTNFNGQAIRMDHDAASRLLARVYPDGTSNTFTYTVTGQRWKMSDASGVTTNKLDGLDRVTQRDHYEAGSLQSRLLYEYEARGNVSRVRGFSASQSGADITYAYDSLDRLEAVSDARSGSDIPQFTTGYTYDLIGNLESCQTTNTVRHQYRYNALNRLTNLVVLAGSVALAQFDYSLGSTGQRDSLIEHVNGVRRTNDWKYDRQYRLTNELLRAASGGTTGQLAYAYDAVANRTNRLSTLNSLPTTSSAYNTNDWLTADVYDSAGNTRTNAAGIVYRYNADNQLTNVVNGATNIAIIYNADGNRIRKTVTVGGTTTQTYYLIDLQTPTGYAQVLEEWVTVAGVSNTRTFYTYGLDLISQRVESGATNYFGYDGHGSVRFLTGSGTNVTDTYTFDAYGTLIARTGSTINRYLYAGEQWDEDLGFYYLRARYFNPGTGRFLNRDTHEGTNEDPLSLHKYLYASPNPVNMVDPSGNVPVVSNFMYGQKVHDMIGAHFLATGSGRVYDESVGLILRIPSVPYLTASRPDLVQRPQDGSPGEVYEIKPVGSFIQGQVQLQYYLLMLRALDPQKRQWDPGSISTYTPPTCISLSWGVFAIVSPPVRGVILYYIEDLRLDGLIIGAYMATQIEMDVAEATLVNTLAPAF